MKHGDLLQKKNQFPISQAEADDQSTLTGSQLLSAPSVAPWRHTHAPTSQSQSLKSSHQLEHRLLLLALVLLPILKNKLSGAIFGKHFKQISSLLLLTKPRWLSAWVTPNYCCNATTPSKTATTTTQPPSLLWLFLRHLQKPSAWSGLSRSVNEVASNGVKPKWTQG